MGGTHISPEEISLMQSYYARGWNYKRIAEQIGRSASSVSQTLKKVGAQRTEMPTQAVQVTDPARDGRLTASQQILNLPISNDEKVKILDLLLR